jgi:pyridoxamine 5'-phosphate oxidase
MTNPDAEPFPSAIERVDSDLEEAFQMEDQLPESLPADPFPTIKAWLDLAYAQKVQPNPNAMTLATVDPDGRPSARIVLLKGLDLDRGTVTFYTNRNSRKGKALAANPRAALVLHWDDLGRQIRLEGPVTLATDAESDAYFGSRHPASRIGAWASDQSEPIESRDELLMKVAAAMERLGVDFDNAERIGPNDIPRPPHWGGYTVWADTVELWLSNAARIHDRAEWTRELKGDGSGGYVTGEWSVTRLQP